MRVGIEGKVLSGRASGIGRYARNLLQSMLRLRPSLGFDLDLVVFTGPQTDRGWLAQLGAGLSEQRSPIKSSVLRSAFTLPRGVARHRLDVFHGLDHVGIPLLRTRARCVVTMHDILPLTHPELFSLKHRLVVRSAARLVFRRADRVIVPSRAVRTEILGRRLISEDRLTVVPEGCDERFAAEGSPEAAARARRKYGLPDRYVLYVGNLDPRKNLIRLVRAFARLDAPDLSLIVVGVAGWRSEALFGETSELGLGRRLIFPGFVDEEDLPAVYRAATVFAFPSLGEGFGLPVLEAMACGVPVITSNLSALPEVAGEAALLVNPKSVEAIAEALQRLIDGPDLRAELARKGLARAARFSWDEAARRTIDVYREVLQEGR